MSANTTGQSENQYESTYALLILGALIAICQFAQQPVNIPSVGLKGADCVACVDESKTLGEARRPEIKG